MIHLTHAFFYFSVPNEGKELALFDFLGKFSDFKTK